MRLLIILLFSGALHAETLKIHTETPLYQDTDMLSPVLLYLHKGDSIEVEPADDPEYFHAHFERGRKLVQGYVQKVDVAAPQKSHLLGLGLQGTYISLNEQGKAFQDGDQVQYTTAAYKSTGFEPFLLAQLHETNFYRLEFGYLRTNYASTAYQNIQGAQSQPLVLQQTLLVLIVEKTWNLFGSKEFYVGLGGELAKGIAVNLTLSGTPVTTTSDDLPIYAGGVVLAGFQKELSRSVSGFAQARVTAIANQNPFILGLDASLGLIFWP